jgi:hypothetical protein
MTIMERRKPAFKQVQAVRCPTCGAGTGEKCELNTGQPRSYPHRDRRLIAADRPWSVAEDYKRVAKNAYEYAEIARESSARHSRDLTQMKKVKIEASDHLSVR